MPDVTIVYWRDIPAQVIVGKGRRGTKRPLAERFEQAIDRAAMKSGMAGTDDYLAEWRKAPTYSVDGTPETVAEAEAVRLETEYDSTRMRALIENDGWASAQE
ncbi:MAG: virulence factor [Pseudomonadota bacterium]